MFRFLKRRRDASNMTFDIGRPTAELTPTNPWDSVTGTGKNLAEENERLKLDLEMSDDLLADAAQVAKRYETALIEAQTAISAVTLPNGTTRKIRRIVTQGLGDRAARPLGQIIK